MTNAEFSNQFDVLYNNIMSNQAPGLDEYEKSVFLTKAQDDIVKAYFNPKGNKFIEGFDGSTQRQIDFSMLMRTEEVTTFGSSIFDGRSDVHSIDLPGNVLSFVNERLEVTRDGSTVLLTIIPISYVEYSLKMSKPYKRPLQYQAWRIMETVDVDSYRKADIVAAPSDVFVKYVARYVKRPRAIVLTNIGDLSIDGVSTAQTCELDPAIHQDILQRAVELAKSAYAGDLQSDVALGQNSQTNKGIVAQQGR